MPLAFDSWELHNPVWTADGRALLVIDGHSTSNGGVARIPIDAPDHAVHLGGLEYAQTLAISRDGTKLAFSRGGGNNDIWRIDLGDGARSGALAAARASCGWPTRTATTRSP